MKKPMTIAAAVLIAAVLAAPGVFGAEEQKGPRIEFQQDRFDIGKVGQGEAVIHVFEFKNTGDEALVINKVETS